MNARVLLIRYPPSPGNLRTSTRAGDAGRVELPHFMSCTGTQQQSHADAVTGVDQALVVEE